MKEYWCEATYKENKPRKYWNAIVIALIVGVFGLQEFCIGRKIRGIFCVLLFWTYIPLIFSFIEALYWLFNGEDEFNKKYNPDPKNKEKQLLTD